MNVKVDYIVDGTRPLLTVLPQNAAMLARIVIPVSNAGFIDVGQSLKIRYDAFPYQKFGTHLGEVVSVSPTMMLPGELVDAPILIQEPSYVVTAKLNTNEISLKDIDKESFEYKKKQNPSYAKDLNDYFYKNPTSIEFLKDVYNFHHEK